MSQPPEDGQEAATGEGSDQPAPTEGPLEGPPGGRIFSLEGRPVPGLYLVAWLLSLGGLAVLFVATQGQPGLVRSLVVVIALIALGLGLASAAGYQVVARADRHPARYRGPSPPIVFGVVLVLSTLASGLLGILDLADPDAPLGFLVGLSVIALAYLVCIDLFVVRAGALAWRDMGWPSGAGDRLRPASQAIGEAILVMIPATFGVLLLGGIVRVILGVEPPDVLPAAANAPEALAVAVAAAVIAPIGEEAFFRGFALTAWLRDLGPREALWRSAGFFALVHLLNISATTGTEGLGQAVIELVVILPLGLVLGWLFLRRGLVASIAGHVAYNAFLLALVLLSPTTPT